MLISGEVRRARDVPGYYEDKLAYCLGTEIWFFDAFALRTGLNRDRAAAGVGLRISKLTVDAALLSAGRPGNKYRLSVSLDGLLMPEPPSEVPPPEAPPDRCEVLTREYEDLTRKLEQRQASVEAERASIADLRSRIATADDEISRLEDEIAALEAAAAEIEQKPTSWTVSKGECLYAISGYARIYDDPLKWPRIYEANRDQIEDADLIFPGQVLRIPR